MCDKQQQESETDRINVTFLCDEWRSSRGGISTFNRELAIYVAKFGSSIVNVYCYVPKSSDQDREDARNNNVNLVTAERVPGSTDPLDRLKIPPPEVRVDVVVSHGRKFGVAAYFIAYSTRCKWIQFVHVDCEDLGKHKKETEGVKDTIEDNENKHESELELCKAAHMVICVGRMLREKYASLLPEINVEVLTPGISENSDENGSKANLKEFKVFVFGRLQNEDLKVKGLDIIGKAVALMETKFKLICVGSPAGKQKELEKWFRKKQKITRKKLTIRRYREHDKVIEMFREADLVVLPSRVEGFGLIALEAISAGIPVLVSSQAGISESLREVDGGCDVIVEPNKPEEWARRINEFSSQTTQERYGKALRLRENYQQIYSWQEETEKFINLVKHVLGGGDSVSDKENAGVEKLVIKSKVSSGNQLHRTPLGEVPNIKRKHDKETGQSPDQVPKAAKRLRSRKAVCTLCPSIIKEKQPAWCDTGEEPVQVKNK